MKREKMERMRKMKRRRKMGMKRQKQGRCRN
jgi:hypothetical protein